MDDKIIVEIRPDVISSVQKYLLQAIPPSVAKVIDIDRLVDTRIERMLTELLSEGKTETEAFDIIIERTRCE